MKSRFLADDLTEVIDRYPFYKKNKKGPFIFIHIPKTGGTSINRAFEFPKADPTLKIKKHYYLADIKKRIAPQIWEQSFKFCFVRNPWDRLYSHYRYRVRRKLIKADHFYDSFKAWLTYHLQENPNKGNLCPQIEWIRDDQGQIDMDFIGRFERLEEDFQKICSINNLQLELPHMLKSNPETDYRQAYDEEMTELVAEYSKEEIRYFDYSF